MAEGEEESNQNQLPLLLSLIETLKKYSEDLQSKSLYLPLDTNSAAIKSLLELESNSSAVFSQFPDLLNVTHLLAHLKTLINKLKSSQSYSLRSFVSRRLIEYQIYNAAFSIQDEIRSWFDRDIVRNLLRVMQGSTDNDDEDEDEEEKVKALVQLESRISMGFDKEMQDLILGHKVFSVLESALCDDSCPPRVRENCAMVIATLARFNKNVFVGLILMGFSVRALVKMGTAGSLHVLSLLMRLIKAHLVDELDLNGEIPRIISKLNSEESCVQKMAMDCVFEMGYFGRKEVIDMLLQCGLIEKLVYLQRVKIGLVDEENEEGENSAKAGSLDEAEEPVDEKRSCSHPFSGCISRFAVQVEVGEGMDKVEKKAVKMEILRRARGACVSEAEAEAAAIFAEVLWGSSP